MEYIYSPNLIMEPAFFLLIAFYTRCYSHKTLPLAKRWLHQLMCFVQASDYPISEVSLKCRTLLHFVFSQLHSILDS